MNKTKIPFLYKFDSNIIRIEDEQKRKTGIEHRIEECKDATNDLFPQLIIFVFFGIIPCFLMILFMYIQYTKPLITTITFSEYIKDKIIPILFISFFTFLFVRMMFIAYNNSLIKKYKRILKILSDNQTKEIKNKIDEDVFENSIKLSYKYLDEYYAQTREQAKKGFYVTIFVAIFGALLIACGIIIMFIGKIEPAYVTCATGIITEFISSIFFYLYNKTIISMRNYHDKLVLSQNVSIALKVVDSINGEEKTKTKTMIVEELLKDINSYLVSNNESNDDKFHFLQKQ